MHEPHRGDYEYHYRTALQQQIVVLKRRLEAAEDGSGMTKLREKYGSERRGLERRIHALEEEVTRLKAEAVRRETHCTRHWYGVAEDIEKYADRKITEERARADAAWEQAARAEAAWQAEHELVQQLQEELRSKDEKIEELEGQIAARNRQLNKNHENSHMPSSSEGLKKKKIHNSRKKTGRKPGAQPGHEGHRRPSLTPTEAPIFVAGPPEIAESDKWELIDVRRKLLADLYVTLKVTPYEFGVYRNKRTGRIQSAEIPPELHNELNYGNGLKAAAFLANTEFNVPARSVREFFMEVSGGAVTLSHGFIAGLAAEFAAKSEAERQQIAQDLLSGAFMHIDTTGAQCESGRSHVTVTANDKAVSYTATRHKGKEAADQTPYAAGYRGVGIHDWEATFWNYVEEHQACHAHLLRELADVVENELDRKWAAGMKALLERIAHERKSWPEDGPSTAWKKGVRCRYTQLVNLGHREYEVQPPSAYFPQGQNLLYRFIEGRDAVLYFLDHPEIPITNNAAERALRVVKRKQSAGMCWRSFGSLQNYCDAKTVLGTERKNHRSCYAKSVEVFGRRLNTTK